MAQSPKFINIPTPEGIIRIPVRYTRPRKFTLLVPVQFCFLTQTGIEHDCDEWGCWPIPPGASR